ncbi:MAG TPA: hypothetical protein VL092_01190, partial [Chitinophagaceae bacterium]|nr:hypothetical protein [Chitinophagaceae bacterium]
MIRYGLTLLAASLLFSACGEKNKPAAVASADTTLVKDLHTLSNADSITIRHLSLDLSVDMEHKQLSGWAEWDIDNSKNAATALRLDNNQLQIDSVWVDGVHTPFTLGGLQEHLGTALIVPISKESKKVRIRYATGTNASALQWLEAAQTTGKKHPFLYTQSESIYARSWVPCPDGPGIRFTYSARISVPKGMMALMSANGNPQQ